MARIKNNKPSTAAKDRQSHERHELKGGRALKPLQHHTRPKDKKQASKPEAHNDHIPAKSEGKRPLEDPSPDITVNKKLRAADSQSTSASQVQVDTDGSAFTWPATVTSSASDTILQSVSTTHSVATLSIISSSNIQTRVTRILSHLSSFDFSNSSPKPPVVQLVAKPGCANKLISVVEIVKRELSKQGNQWYQYNGVESKTVEVQRKADKNITTILGREIVVDSEAMDVGGDTSLPDELTFAQGTGILAETGEEDTFETMKTPLERAIEGRPKVKAVAVMTTWLSRVRVDGLKTAYG